MRFDMEPDTDCLTLTLDNGDKVYLPTNMRDLWYTIKPYMPDWGTPKRLLVSLLQSVAVCVIGSVILAVGAFSALSAGVYLGPLAGVIVAVMFVLCLWELSGILLERMKVADDLTIARFKRNYDTDDSGRVFQESSGR